MRQRPYSVLAVLALSALVATACGPKDEALEAFEGGAQIQGGARQSGSSGADDAAAFGGGGVGGEGSSLGEAAAGEAGGEASGDAAGAAGSEASSAEETSGATAPAGATVGVSDKEIRFGIHLPETIGGVNVGAILKLRQLSEAFWNYTNDVKGGVNGRKVKVLIADDGYEVGRALQACRDLEAQKVFFISGTAGSDQVVACGQYAVKRNITYTSLGVTEAGLVGNPNYFAFTITYEKQGPLMAKYIVNRLGGKQKKVAMVRFNSPNADGGHRTFVDAYKRLAGKGLVADDAVDKNANQSELTSECIKLQQAGAEIVTLLAAPTVTGGLAQACLAQGYHPQWVAWANTLGCTVEPPFGGPGMDGCLGFQVTRHPEAVQAPIEKECHEAWNKYQGGSEFPADGETFCALFDFYRKALTDAGRDLNVSSFQKALRAMKYDNGLANPIQMSPDQIGSTAVAVWVYDSDTQSSKEANAFATDF